MNGAFALRARTLVTDASAPGTANGGVVVIDGKIVDVGGFRDLRAEGLPVVDIAGTLMPGMIDAHSHLRGIPLAEHGIPQRQLEPWLCSLAASAPLSPADEARLATAELLETGVTAVQGIVHSFAPDNDYRALLAATTIGVRESGIRGLIVLGFSDRAELAPEPAVGGWANIPEVEHGMSAAEFGTLAAAWLDDEAEPTISWGVGPVASQWASADALAQIAGLPQRTRLHTHLNESIHQRTWVAGEAAPVARLDAAGLFNHRLSAAHAVHLRDDEIALAAERGVTLVHCPSSNLALRVGVARVAEWLRRGAPAALGLDSQNTGPADVFDVMRQVLDLSEELGDPVDEDQALGLATIGGAAALGDPRLGRIVPGAAADLVALTLETDSSEAVVELVRRGSADAVDTVWVDGAQRVAQGRALLDTEPVRRRLRAELDADAAARARRLDQLAPTIDIVNALVAGANR